MIRDLADPIVELMKNIPKRESMQSYMEEYSSPLITQPPTPDAVTSSAETDIDRKEEQGE